MTKSETALIEIKSSSYGGNQVFQLPSNMRRNENPDRARRDNYTTLLMGNWACKCYFDLIYTEEESLATFKPFFIK